MRASGTSARSLRERKNVVALDEVVVARLRDFGKNWTNWRKALGGLNSSAELRRHEREFGPLIPDGGRISALGTISKAATRARRRRHK